MDNIKVYLTNKKRKYYSWLTNQTSIKVNKNYTLYCWEFEQTILKPDQYYYKTKKNLYRLFFDGYFGYWIGRLSSDQFNGESWFTVEKELGAVYCETLKGRFYWK